MKSIPLLLLFFLATVSTTLAQDRPTQQRETQAGTTQQEPSAQPQAVPGQHQESTLEGAGQNNGRRGFVDEDGDGINDRVGQGKRAAARNGEGQKPRNRRNDRFIDSDGDGIHDQRGGGTGLRRGRRHGAAKGGGQ